MCLQVSSHRQFWNRSSQWLTEMKSNKFQYCLSSTCICWEHRGDWVPGILAWLGSVGVETSHLQSYKLATCLKKKVIKDKSSRDMIRLGLQGLEHKHCYWHLSFLYRSKSGGKTCSSPSRRESTKVHFNLPPCNSCRVFNWEKSIIHFLQFTLQLKIVYWF